MARPSLRDKLVEAALERLHAQGFSGCSVQDITEAAGAPKGSFYNHFKTKELLALEALNRYRNESRVDILLKGADPPLQRLQAHFEFLAERQKRWDFQRGCMIGNFGTDMADAYPAMRAALADTMRDWAGAIAAVLRQAQAQGAVSADKDPDRIARFLVDAWEGVVIRARMVKSGAPFDDFFEVAFADLLGAGAPGGRCSGA